MPDSPRPLPASLSAVLAPQLAGLEAGEVREVVLEMGKPVSSNHGFRRISASGFAHFEWDEMGSSAIRELPLLPGEVYRVGGKKPRPEQLLIGGGAFACPYCAKRWRRGGHKEGFVKSAASNHVVGCYEVAAYLAGFISSEDDPDELVPAPQDSGGSPYSSDREHWNRRLRGLLGRRRKTPEWATLERRFASITLRCLSIAPERWCSGAPAEYEADDWPAHGTDGGRRECDGCHACDDGTINVCVDDMCRDSGEPCPHGQQETCWERCPTCHGTPPWARWRARVEGVA